MIRLLLTGALLAATTSVASAQSLADWEQAGSRAINPGRGTETVFVFGNDSHRQIRLCAVNASIGVLSIEIEYESGEKQPVAAQFIVERGQCSEAIDLVARRRSMEKLVLTYTPFTADAGTPRLRVDAR